MDIRFGIRPRVPLPAAYLGGGYTCVEIGDVPAPARPEGPVPMRGCWGGLEKATMS